MSMRTGVAVYSPYRNDRSSSPRSRTVASAIAATKSGSAANESRRCSKNSPSGSARLTKSGFRRDRPQES